MTERESSGDELVGDERLNPTEQESEGDREGPASGQEETNDEPAQGEGGQDAV
jgi:hypothetical protein